MKNILENEYHVNVIDKWIKVCKRNDAMPTMEHILWFVSNFLFPEYKHDPQLAEKIKIILSYQNN
jgi:hypothetical protein